MQVARRFLIKGDVQGVGYRFFAQRAAARHQVVGYVRNCPDGTVEALAEGSASSVEAFKHDLATVYLVIIQVQYQEGTPESYLLPMAYAEDRAQELRQSAPGAVVASLTVDGDGALQEGLLYDPSGDDAFARALLDAIARRRLLKGPSAEVVGLPSRA